MKKSILLLMTLVVQTSFAQMMDKADLDRQVFDLLSSTNVTVDWHPDLSFSKDSLEETAEKGIFRVRGDFFQVKSVRSDYYIVQKEGKWIPLYDARFPLEVLTNLLLNRLEDNRHMLALKHHQYGNVKKELTIPMQNLFDALGQYMQLYCSVTHLNKKDIHAVLVFHQQRLDYIHMLELRTNLFDLFDKTSTFTADFYTNIPQGNINDIFYEKKQ